MDERIKGENGKKVISMLVILITIVVTVLFNSYLISNELEQQLQQNLEDVSNQNALALHNKIHSNYQLLRSLSAEVQNVSPDTIDETLRSFTIYLEDYDLKRFAYSFPDGTSYSTDGGVANLSYREFFKRGYEGKGTITGILNDALEEHHDQVNVMTIPVYDKQGNVEGVFGLTYDSRDFNDALQIESFDGQGYSCAINDEGQILVAMGNDRFRLSENLFVDVLGTDERNTEAIANIQQHIADKSSNGGTFYLDEKHYYYCRPVELMEGDVIWYMLTIIPADVLESRVAPVQEKLYLMALAVTLFILLGVVVFLMLSRDRKKLMLRYAYEDPLTQGANYAKFCVDMRKKRNWQGYVVVMDIMNFNHINIAAGKVAGDRMICDVWQILTEELQPDEAAGHVREDIFVLYLNTEQKEMLIERLKRLSERINHQSKALQVRGIHARYGIYEMQGTENLEDAYSKAQIAREQARTEREQHYVFYHEMDHEKLQQNRQLEERFDEALAAGDFEVWYQPKYSVASGEIVGSEALVRWREKDGSLISPGRFIPLFEQNGMIARLDEYMFRAVCKQQAQWLAQGRRIYPVSINLSRASLYYADVVDKYQAIIQDSGISPVYIQLEITESAIEGRTSIRELLEKFRSMGIRILMDDFGTGYSSLATLNMRCFDTLKLDKSLIDHIGDQNGETLLCYVISMGQHLGLHITAEGVENNMQLEFLKENHCDDIQGYLFAKPMPVAEFELRLNEK
ncbi:MAG: GGDEF domain-containing protein [Lachnospiraceae bacterium]|nr:GGDEF domain-containing protein [Lachnospiraceae bacterium]